MYMVHWYSKCTAIGLLTTTMQFNWVKEVDNTASVQWGLAVCFNEFFISHHVRSVYHNLKSKSNLSSLVLHLNTEALFGIFLSWGKPLINICTFEIIFEITVDNDCVIFEILKWDKNFQH